MDVAFSAPDGRIVSMPAFYDGAGIWKVRFNPGQPGEWRWQAQSHPADPGLEQSATFTVGPNGARGFLHATPGQSWGFHYENGEPAFILGDTAYNLFGMAYCGGDVTSFMERRADQGFNLLRVRLPVSPFHPPDAHSAWQNRRTWPWGGSEQSPQFDRFNLPYFKAAASISGRR